MDISEKIKTLRKQRGLTLEAVGSVVGVGKSTVRKWENGDIKNMRRDKIALLAQALGVTPGYLMGWESYDETEAEPAQQPRDEINMSPAKLDRWIMLSNAFNEMSTPEFEMWFNAIRANHPEFFNERTDDDDPES